MSMEKIAETVSAALAGKDFDGSLKFDCGTDGVLVLEDGAVHQKDKDTDCTLAMSIEDPGLLLRGKLNPMKVMAFGKLKFSGSMPVALKLMKLL